MSSVPRTSPNDASTIGNIVHKNKFNLKSVVSQSRVRFQDDVFDLDLSYITKEIIAMGLPACTAMEQAYRNAEDDVAAMLNHYHKNRYMIWNLSQRTYTYSKFGNQVLEFGWPDHHAPPLHMTFQICQAMSSWIKADPNNVCIVHCKAGKGRTGCVIACYLLFAGLFDDPEDAMAYFAYRRSLAKASKGGVTIPSQRRYVHYFHQILQGYRPNLTSFRLTSIFFHNPPQFDSNHGCNPSIEIYRGNEELIYASKYEKGRRLDVNSPVSKWTQLDLTIKGDFLLRAHHHGMVTRESMFRFNLHTGFFEEMTLVTLEKKDLDDGYKDARIPENFRVEMIFDVVPSTPGSGATADQATDAQDAPWQNIVQQRRRHLHQLTQLFYNGRPFVPPSLEAKHVADIFAAEIRNATRVPLPSELPATLFDPKLKPVVPEGTGTPPALPRLPKRRADASTLIPTSSTDAFDFSPPQTVPSTNHEEKTTSRILPDTMQYSGRYDDPDEYDDDSDDDDEGDDREVILPGHELEATQTAASVSHSKKVKEEDDDDDDDDETISIPHILPSESKSHLDATIKNTQITRPSNTPEGIDTHLHEVYFDDPNTIPYDNSEDSESSDDDGGHGSGGQYPDTKSPRSSGNAPPSTYSATSPPDLGARQGSTLTTFSLNAVSEDGQPSTSVGLENSVSFGLQTPGRGLSNSISGVSSSVHALTRQVSSPPPPLPAKPGKITSSTDHAGQPPTPNLPPR